MASLSVVLRRNHAASPARIAAWDSRGDSHGHPLLCRMGEIVRPHDIDALSMVVLGASGDLAKKKTFPAIFTLYARG